MRRHYRRCLLESCMQKQCDIKNPRQILRMMSPLTSAQTTKAKNVPKSKTEKKKCEKKIQRHQHQSQIRIDRTEGTYCFLKW